MVKLKKLVIGVDIGGTTTKFGIVDSYGNIRYHGSIPTNEFATAESFVDALHHALQGPIEEVGGLDEIKGIGIGAPNGNFYNGTIEYAPNLNWKGIIPMVNIVKEKFGIPAALTNDANAAAVGEMQYGAAKGMKDFIMITLGTGVGSGIVANGQLIYGHDGFAGELGHLTIIPNGRLHWGTGKHGSLEAYASATGIAITAKELLEQHQDIPSELRNINPADITSKKVFEAAVSGDEIGKRTFEYTGAILGLALANFVMFTSPEAIVLFGGPTKAGDFIMNPTKKSMEENLLPVFQNKVKLIFSELPEADAAILGASALVWELK
jgi:glucokinase